MSMIEVLLMPCGQYRWFMISAEARVLVLGSFHDCDIQANDSAKEYRRAFQALARTIDTYVD